MKAPDNDWVTPVIAFLSGNLPHIDDGWEHMFSTPYQIGCEALVALGVATEIGGGAIRRENPERPEELPRWDDICVAVLRLAEQQNKLEYRLPDGTRPPPRTQWRVKNPPAPPPPNILSAHGLGLARADEEVSSVLIALGLIGGEGRWTEQAELVLWRDQPRAWDMNVISDPRFVGAAWHAVEDIPPVIRTEIGRLVTISEKEVEAHIQRHNDAIEEGRKKYGPKARFGAPMTPESAVKSLHLWRRDELDWVFFRHWRLAEGWLTSDQSASALRIFHDPLAKQIRRAVLIRLHPDLPHFAE